MKMGKYGSMENWLTGKMQIYMFYLTLFITVQVYLKVLDVITQKTALQYFVCGSTLKGYLIQGKFIEWIFPYTVDELCDAIIEIIKVNDLKDCYIRPVAFRGYHELGVYPLNCPLETVIAAWEWGKYLGEDAIENGVDLVFPHGGEWRQIPSLIWPRPELTI